MRSTSRSQPNAFPRESPSLHDQALEPAAEPAEAVPRLRLGGSAVRRLPLPRRPYAVAEEAEPPGAPAPAQGDRLPVVGLRPAQQARVGGALSAAGGRRDRRELPDAEARAAGAVAGVRRRAPGDRARRLAAVARRAGPGA